MAKIDSENAYHRPNWYMWEDINHSGDGGLYAELLQNRAFQAVTAGTSAAYVFNSHMMS
jgi:hypothetical protein